jgi:hypothetical protein
VHDRRCLPDKIDAGARARHARRSIHLSLEEHAVQPCRIVLALSLTGALIASTAGVVRAAGTPPATRADAGHAWPELPYTTWALDSARVATVRSVLIQRDAGSLLLEDGRLVLARPLGGHDVALVFSGIGTLAFTPPTVIEHEQLRRFMGVRALRRRFRSLVIVATDSTFEELLPGLAFQADTLRALARAWHEALPYLVKNEDLRQAIADREPGLFWAVAWEPRQDPLFLVLDPFAVECVQLWRTPEGSRLGLWNRHAHETVCQFRAQGDSDTTLFDLRAPYEAEHYALSVSLASDLHADATAEVTVRARGRPRTWFTFDMASTLTLDSVRADGVVQAFDTDRATGRIWVHASPPVPDGGTRTFRFRYHGLLFEREADRIYTPEPIGWYPTPWYGGEATWDLSFRCPRAYQLVAPGRRVASGSDGGDVTSRWLVERAVPWASFDVSFLRGLQVDVGGPPRLTVWERSTDGAGRVRQTDAGALAAEKGHLERVAFDVARATRFYRDAFGAPVVDSVDAVEVSRVMDPDRPTRVSYEAFPGLVRMMTPEDKVGTGVEWTPDFLRAHELAHQWWGIGVRPASYHDAWMSEGFANFCALWYLQAGRHDTETYLATLGEWRDALLQNRRFLLGAGQQAGPVWLGSRTNSSTTEDDYGVIVYKKGAWVLHMLRNLLLDLDTGDETRFRTLLHDFHMAHRNGYATTAEFRAAAEAATGDDLGWFFAQWVYGTDVPTYHWSWDVAEHAAGQWVVHGRVQQTNVPDGFRAPVIVRLDFGGGRFARTRVWVSGPETTFDLPATSERPTSVRFNDLESVLAEVVRPK